MKFCMRFFIRKQLQVFRSIVLLILNRTKRIFDTLMVNNFSWLKIALKHLFHYEMRTENITIGSYKGMFRFINKDISLRNSFTAFPKWSFFSTTIRKFFTFAPRNISFFKFCCRRKVNTFFIFIPRYSVVTISFCSYINSTRHSITSKIKAPFRYLREQRLSYSTLLSADFRYKNTVSLLDKITIPLFNNLSRTKCRYPSLDGSV